MKWGGFNLFSNLLCPGQKKLGGEGFLELLAVEVVAGNAGDLVGSPGVERLAGDTADC